ncbi:DUF503 domain-containing protein [Thermodesulfobacteriota bacterium]
MVVGVCRVILSIPGNASLKGKRKVLRAILDRTRNKFNASIAEVGDNDLWQRSELGITLVANDMKFVNSSLDKILNFIDSLNVAEIVDHEMELISL